MTSGAASARASHHLAGNLPPHSHVHPPSADLQPFDEALDLLAAGPLRALIFEKRAQIKPGIAPFPTELEARASAKLALMPAEQTAHLVRTFFSRSETNSDQSPLVHYGIIANPPHHQDRPSPESYTRMAQSLLSTGLLPNDDIRESIELARLSLLNQPSDPTESFTSWLATSAVVATWMFYPPAISAIITIAYLSIAWGALSNRNVSANAAEGYILETLDAYETIRTGNVSTIGASLEKHFGDPSNKVNYSNHWRSDGFAIARALRALGHPTEKTFELFRDHSGLNNHSNTLVTTVRGLLTDHDAPVPPAMLLAFIEDPDYGETWDATNHLLEALNTVYFTSAIFDKEVQRRKFMEFVLAAA
jgi:hypothetical protein